LFGGLDVNYRSVHSGDNRFSGIGTDGAYSSRIGVRGTEDLGGGLKANFHLEGSIAPDAGLGTSSGGLNFQRRSVLGVEGGFGSVVIGRDYTPLFGVSGVVDPFSTNGVGSSYNLLNNIISTAVTLAPTTFRTSQSAATGSAAPTFAGTTWGDPSAIRMSNAIAYTSPVMSGFSVAAMYSFGNENTGSARAAGTGASARLTYAQGPLAISFGSQAVKGGEIGTTSLAGTDRQKWITNFLGGSYDFGILKLSAGYKIDMLTSDAALSDRLKGTIVGVSAPVGPVVLRASYVERRLGDDKIGNQAAVGVSYDLSKRTAVYANYADLDNEAGYGMSINGTSNGGAVMSTAGGRSRGLEMGVRHIF
jgi:predicted porin